MTVINCGRKIEVDSLEEASRVIRNYIDTSKKGSTAWYMHDQNGFVYDNNELVAHISYNGRIWPEGVN